MEAVSVFLALGELFDPIAAALHRYDRTTGRLCV
jgi:hypothetical protein